MNIVFMGSPEFAVPILRGLAEQYSVVGVITQPDRPAGRGQILTPPPIKILAQSLKLDLIQPVKLREPFAWDQLQAWEPDLIVVAAFGQILRQKILDLPPFGCINVHASLLPRWRGAAPIQAAILNGDDVTGATIMKMDAGIDTGPILAQREVIISNFNTYGSLLPRLAELGAELLMDTLPEFLAGRVTPVPQDESRATYAKMIEKEEAHLDLSQTAQALVWRVRAFQPWPGTTIPWQGGQLKIIQAHDIPGECEVGERSIITDLPAVGTASGWLVIDKVQPAGKKMMPGHAFLQGVRGWVQASGGVNGK